jgi:beta-1,4-mannosyltransferase
VVALNIAYCQSFFMSKKEIKISCLPVAGLENPYQKLMMEGISSKEDLQVQYGFDGKFFAILKTVVLQKPDILHLDWIQKYYIRRKEWMTWLLFPLFIIEVFLVDKFTNVKLVWTLHNIIPHDLNNSRPKKWCRSFFARSCDWIRVFDEKSIHKAVATLNVTKDKFKVVPEGSYVDYYKNNTTKEDSRKELSLAMDNFVYLYLGSIKPYKGIENLLQSFKKIKNERALLIIAGKSFNDEYLKELKIDHPRVKLHDEFVPDDQLDIYFNAADVVVLPFNNVENSGSVILAMGFKKPIIAPNMGVLKRRLTNQSDLLYSDKIEFQKIMKTVSSRSDIKEIGQSNFEELKKYQWSDFTKQFAK